MLQGSWFAGDKNQGCGINLIKEASRFMRLFILLLCFTIFMTGCKYSSSSFQITKDGVFSKSRIITQFSISQYKIESENLDDIRPNSHTELMRYCCELKANKSGSKKILFKSDNSRYRWSLCKLDTSIVTNDSLNALTFEDKSRYLEERTKFEKRIPKEEMALSFIIKKGFVYQIFGLPDLDGSYYFRLDSDDKLIVKFFDNGAW